MSQRSASKRKRADGDVITLDDEQKTAKRQEKTPSRKRKEMEETVVIGMPTVEQIKEQEKKAAAEAAEIVNMAAQEQKVEAAQDVSGAASKLQAKELVVQERKESVVPEQKVKQARNARTLIASPLVNGKQICMEAFMHAFDTASEAARDKNRATFMRSKSGESEEQAEASQKKLLKQIAGNPTLAVSALAAQALIEENPKRPAVASKAVRERAKSTSMRQIRAELEKAAKENDQKKAEEEKKKAVAAVSSVGANSSTVVASSPTVNRFVDVASKSNAATAPVAVS